MMTAPQLHFSYEDYLRALDDSPFALEYCAGTILAKPRGTLTHAELSAAAIGILRQLLLHRCSVMTSDAKVRVESSDFAAFPDALVLCGERQTSRIDPNALTNPTLLVEVTSRSTEQYDRGEKLAHYQRLPSLEAVLFISHRERRVTLVERGTGWVTVDLEAGERVTITEPAVTFAVDELYEGITLDPA
jgi:Uma2 family endonuclease